MRYALSSVVIVLAACLACSARGEAAEVYKWTDAKGVVHYADAPPDGQKYERVKVSSGATTTSAGEEPDPADAVPAKEENPEDAMARYTAARAQNCKIARDNLAAFEQFPDVQKDTDGDGKPEVLNAEQREAEIARNRDLVARSCTE